MSYFPSSYKVRSGPGVSVFSPAAGQKKTAGLIEKETVPFWRSFTRAPPLAASVQSDPSRYFEKANIEY